jgi:hypothetical protein
MKICPECFVINGHHPNCPDAELWDDEEEDEEEEKEEWE